MDKEQYIKEHGKLGRELLDTLDGNLEDAIKAMEANYLGCYKSVADYAEQYINSYGADIPDFLNPYIDFDGLGWDMVDDCIVIEFIKGEVYIFDF